MSWKPISGAPPQFQKSDGTLASGYYLKFYQTGTTTPFSMATDTTGASTLAKCQINSSGYPINGSGDVFVPHYNQAYKLALYKNATDADNDTTANADWVVDALPSDSSASTRTNKRGSEASGQVFTIPDYSSGSLEVYRNGNLLTLGADYTETSSTTITIDSSITIASSDYWTFRVTTSLYSSINFNIWAPSDATGATDMALELETFLADNQGKRVEVAPGSTILLASTVGQLGQLTGSYSVDLDLKDTIVLCNNDTIPMFFDNTGNASSESAVTTLTDTYVYSNSSPSTQVDLSTTLSVQAHDFVCIYAEDTAGTYSTKVGEIAQVLTDESGNTFYTSGHLCRTGLFSTSIKCRKLSKTGSIKIRGGIFRSNGDADDQAITTREECIKIFGFVDSLFKDIVFDGPWAQCIWHQACAMTVIDNCGYKDVFDNGPDSVNGYSYMAYPYGMNYGTVVKNCVSRNGRHSIFTTGGNEAGSSTWYNYGYPTKALITNCVSYNNYAAAFDTHEQGADIVFMNCQAFNSASDNNGTIQTIGKGFNSRAFRDKFINCYTYGGGKGFNVTQVDHGEQNVVRFIGCTAEDIYNGSGSGVAFDFNNHLSGRIRVEATDCNVIGDARATDVGPQRGFNVGEYVEFIYRNLNISGLDLAIYCSDNSVSKGSGLFLDFSNTAHTGGSPLSYCVFMNDTCTFLCYDSPIIIMGPANNIPREFFNDADGTGTKTVWHNGLIVDDRGNTATISKEATGTFTNSTEINSVAL